MRICVVGNDAFTKVLREAMENEAVSGHPLVVDSIRSPDMLQGCHLAFVAAAYGDARSVLQAAMGRAVLTVGEAANFLEAGGIVRFVVVDGRVRFDINVPSAAAGGLELSSRVLQVARYVRQ